MTAKSRNGASDDEKMQSFINEDMKKNPLCRYSVSSQKECSSTNGNFACETIRRVFRNCPGLRPEQVYDMTTRDSGTVSRSPGEGEGGGAGGGGGGGGHGGIPFFGGRASQHPHGIPSVIPPDEWPFGGRGMDDVFGHLNDRINSFFKDSPFAHPDPDVNHGGHGSGAAERSAEPSWSSESATTPRVLPPHKHEQPQSKARGSEKRPGGGGEASGDGSVVARA